jgi:hypothetical protein
MKFVRNVELAPCTCVVESLHSVNDQVSLEGLKGEVLHAAPVPNDA